MHHTQSHLSSLSKEYHVTSNRIGASAGTGKTYQLASRYIALLVLGVSPEEIIALTFTRKAAGEFRNRILQALAEGADDKRDEKTGRNELTVRVWEALSGLKIETADFGAWKAVEASNPVPLLPVTAALVQEAANMKQYPEQLYKESPSLQHYYKFPEPDAATFKVLLRKMVAVLSKLQLSTIDSFFSSLVTTNSLELGMNQVSPLDPTEEDNVRAVAIRRYLDAQGACEQTRADFLEMFSRITGGVGNRTQSQIESDLKDFLRLYRELPPQTRWGSIDSFPNVGVLRIATAEEQEIYTNNVAELGRLLETYGGTVLEPKVCSQLRDLVNGETYIKRDAAKMVNHYANLPLLAPALTTLLEAFYQNAELNDELNQAIRLWEDKGSNHILHKAHNKAVSNIITELRKENTRKLSASQQQAISTLEAAVRALGQVSDANTAILIRIALLAETLAKHAIPCKLRAAAVRSESLHKLLDGYAAIYDARIKADGRLTFDDISRMAKELMLKEPGNDQLLRHHIAYRMGGRISHWMLDEFQDTSEAQFRTLTPLLKPIVEDAGSNAIDFSGEQWTAGMPACLQNHLKSEKHCVAGESLFIVGDTKQSIYGFRTGKTEVFDRLASEEPWKSPLQPSPLSCSFRSSSVIMDFTNELFTALGEVEKQPENAKDGIEKLPVTFSEDFSKHKSARDFSGYAEMSFIAPPGEDEDDASQKDLIYDKVVEVLRTLTDADSKPRNGMSIAILVRSNDNADEIQKHLVSKMPALPTLLVKDSLAAAACPMGEILLYFFKWLLHPGDLAAFNVVRASFLADFIGKEPSVSHAKLMQELQSIGFLGMMHTLKAKLPEEDAQANQSIILRWLNEAVVFDAKGATLSEWVQHMKNLSMQAAGASGAVQIMTMHKSKGLEFDAVILPYTSREASDATKHLTCFVVDDCQSLILPPGGKKEWARFGTLFTSMTAQWQQQQRKEAYNLLYVAITRAKRANYIICHGARLVECKPLKSGEIKEDWKGCAHSTGGLLRQACVWMGPQEEVSYDTLTENHTYITRGNPSWYEELKPKYTDSELTSYIPPLGAAIPRRKRSNPSKLAKAEDKQTKEPEAAPKAKSTTMSYAGTKGADFGTMVHECWETIEWKSDAADAWYNTIATSPLSDKDAERARQVVAAALQQPEVAALFTRQPGQVVYNEQPIEAINDKDEWVSATLDRLVITHDAAGNVTAAHIIDFKTNKLVPTAKEPNPYEGLRKEYTAQMTAYKKLIRDAFNLSPESVTVSLISCPKDGTSAQVLTYTNEALAERQ